MPCSSHTRLPPTPEFTLHIDQLHGDALDAALARRFAIAETTVQLGEWPVVLHKPDNSDHLISEADYVMDERLPYWADLWTSSRVLAMSLLEERGAGRSLLEMGCGLGLATIAAMRAGFDVLATDYYIDAIHMTRANAWRNLGVEPRVRMVNWREWPADLGRFDVIIAADVLYENEYATLVAQCISRAIAPGGVALIADPGRTALPTFKDTLPQAGLRLGHITTRHDMVDNRRVEVMHIHAAH